MTTEQRPVILIVGPTAGGKSGLALSLAQRLPGGGEIISADSMQVYRGMDIGTAKPTREEQQLVPHHLIDVVEPDEPFSVDDWLKAAERCIAEIRARGRWPIVVGGTNLYVKAFLEGLFEGPPPDDSLRAQLAGWSLADLHAEVARVDPASAQRIHRNDRKRLTRALEVHRATGKPLSQWQSQWSGRARRGDVTLIGLDWPVEAINPRINARVKAMLEAGLVDEVKALHAASRLGSQAREALGYKQLLAALEGNDSLEAAVEQIKIETRRFARKQRTWLKSFRLYPDSCWIACAGLQAQDIAHQAFNFISTRTGGNPPAAHTPA
ncbi:MAG: tRNA (adenosine(37)-N6)-dimethylallyltransferase MiaA [Phycisphaerales bacterium]|nr:tRNA (adenosine(37)-N6)-dimethylallyltransferase MiaA [Phycisphaerales bacterium]